MGFEEVAAKNALEATNGPPGCGSLPTGRAPQLGLMQQIKRGMEFCKVLQGLSEFPKIVGSFFFTGRTPSFSQVVEVC